LKAGSLLSRTGSYSANGCSVIFSFCKNRPAHENREENVNKNVKSKPFPSPATAPKFLIGVKPALENVYFEISVKMCELWLLRYSVIA